MAFTSERQRKWYFANKGKSSGGSSSKESVEESVKSGDGGVLREPVEVSCEGCGEPVSNCICEELKNEEEIKKLEDTKKIDEKHEVKSRKKPNEISVPDKYAEQFLFQLKDVADHHNIRFTYRDPIDIDRTFFTFENVREKNKILREVKIHLLPRRDIIRSLR